MLVTLTERELMELVSRLQANKGLYVTGTSNWAAYIGKGVQDAIIAKNQEQKCP